jgi:hypothetical protein
MKIKLDLTLPQEYITQAVLTQLREDGIIGDLEERLNIVHLYGERYEIMVERKGADPQTGEIY